MPEHGPGTPDKQKEESDVERFEYSRPFHETTGVKMPLSEFKTQLEELNRSLHDAWWSMTTTRWAMDQKGPDVMTTQKTIKSRLDYNQKVLAQVELDLAAESSGDADSLFSE